MDDDFGPVAKFFWFVVVPVVVLLLLWSWQPWFGGSDEVCGGTQTRMSALECREYQSILIDGSGY